jgi:hypothetical protein
LVTLAPDSLLTEWGLGRGDFMVELLSQLVTVRW